MPLFIVTDKAVKIKHKGDDILEVSGADVVDSDDPRMASTRLCNKDMPLVLKTLKEVPTVDVSYKNFIIIINNLHISLEHKETIKQSVMKPSLDNKDQANKAYHKIV